MGLAHDGEEAFLWLSRCAKQLAELVALDPSQPSGGSGCTAEKVGSGTALPALMSEAGCRHIFAQVGGRP